MFIRTTPLALRVHADFGRTLTQILAPASLVPAPYRLLLAGRDVSRLPSPLPLDLAELPIIRAVQQLELSGTQGMLPEPAYRTRIELVEGRTRFEITIEGSTTHGLPYGLDGEILHAIFTLYDQFGSDGVLHDVSFRRIADVLGKSWNSELGDRIRGALFRLGNVRIIGRIQPDHELAAAIERGEATPTPPATRRAELKSATVQNIINVSYIDVDGESWLDHIEINSIFVEQGITGWLAWIDLPLYAQIGRPIAQRLYEIAASQCAKGRPAPWTLPVERVTASCAIPVPRTTVEAGKIRANLKANGEALVQAGVLRSFEVKKVRPKVYQVEMTPGPALDPALMLRGVGTLDGQETRILLMLLGSIGITGATARRIVQDKHEAAYWALAYLRYVREELPERDQIENPAGFVRRILDDNRNLAADHRFREWHERKLRSEIPSAPAEPAPVPAPLPVRAAQPLPAGDPKAEQLWTGVRDRLRSRYKDTSGIIVMTGDLAGLRIDGDVLVCQTRNSFALEWTSHRHKEEIEGDLNEITRGAITRFDIVLVA